jgi:CDP-paratose 2-epimerase
LRNNEQFAMSNPKSLRLLITGICGFAGSVIARHLLAHSPGLSIVGFDNLSRRGSEMNVEPLRALGIDVRIGDVRDRAFLDTLPPVDWVLDCAANPSVLAGVDGSDTRDLVDQNLYGTINLLELCKTWTAGFILLSTSRVYSIPPLAGLPLHESPTRFVPDLPVGIADSSLSIVDSNHLAEDPVAARATGHTISNQQSTISPSGVTDSFPTTPPVSLYGSTKICSELLALEYGETFGFPVWINRCGVLAGAGQFGKADQGIFSYWIHSWKAGRPLKYIGFGGSGKQVRDCLHPRDLVPLLMKQMAASHAAGIADCSLSIDNSGEASASATIAPPATSDLSTFSFPLSTFPKVINVSGGIANSMSLLELSTWCAARFPGNSENCSLLIDNSNQLATQPEGRGPGFPSAINNQQSAISNQQSTCSGSRKAGTTGLSISNQQSAPPSRPFDIPWMVLDSSLAKETWDWSPATPLHDILEEIAQHAEANPDWLKIVS